MLWGSLAQLSCQHCWLGCHEFANPQQGHSCTLECFCGPETASPGPSLGCCTRDPVNPLPDEDNHMAGNETARGASWPHLQHVPGWEALRRGHLLRILLTPHDCPAGWEPGGTSTNRPSQGEGRAGPREGPEHL